MIRVLDSAGSTLVEWGRQQQHNDSYEMLKQFCLWNSHIFTHANLLHCLVGEIHVCVRFMSHD